MLGRDFIPELYVHMGFHPAWKYRHVVEVTLDHGRTTSVVDCSEAMGAVRDKLAATARGPGGGATHDEIRAWVERTFSRRY